VKTSSPIIGALAAAMLLSALPSNAATAKPSTCALLPLADVRAITGNQVQVYQPGSSAPTVSGNSTFSTCTYVVPNTKGRAATVTLMWAPSAKLKQTSDFYVERQKEATEIKGDVFIVASVTDSSTGTMVYDHASSEKLLALAASKLP
jgi:hypothetical protein